MSNFLDTGYDLINLEASIVARYYQDVPGANSQRVPGQYTFPCKSSLPDLKLTINGGGVTIRGQVLKYHPSDVKANSKWLSSHPLKLLPIIVVLIQNVK